MAEPKRRSLDRAVVDTWFGVVFIVILVVLVYPTTYMYLHSVWGPEPPDFPLDADPENPEHAEAFAKSGPATWFMAVNQAWFVVGVLLPVGVAPGVYRLARRIFKAAHPSALKWAAALSVPALYAVGTLYSVL